MPRRQNAMPTDVHPTSRAPCVLCVATGLQGSLMGSQNLSGALRFTVGLAWLDDGLARLVMVSCRAATY